MSKFKIEKVDHSILCEDLDICCVVAYYQTSDTLSQANFMKESTAILAKNRCTTGIWRKKKINL